MSSPAELGGASMQPRAATPWMTYEQARHASSANGTMSQPGSALGGGVPHHLAALHQTAQRPQVYSVSHSSEQGRNSMRLSGTGGAGAVAAPGSSSIGPRNIAGNVYPANGARGQGGSTNQIPKRAAAVGGKPHPEGAITQQQLDVLRDQILVFRRLKKGEVVRREDILESITPLPLPVRRTTTQPLSVFPAAQPKPTREEMEVIKQTADNGGEAKPAALVPTFAPLSNDVPNLSAHPRAPLPPKDARSEEQKRVAKEEERKKRRKEMRRAKTAALKAEADRAVQATLAPTAGKQGKEEAGGGGWGGCEFAGLARFEGPLYGLPPPESGVGIFGGERLGYSGGEVLADEGRRVMKRKRERKMEELGCLLEQRGGGGEERRRMRIRSKMLLLMDRQAHLRAEVEADGAAIAAMGERSYRTFVKWVDKQKADLVKQSLQTQKASREKFLKALFHLRKNRMESQWTAREGRGARNRGVLKCHEKLQRDASKRKDEDRNKRMEALKNNDVDAYRGMLEEQQKSMMPGDAKERFEVLSSFLSQTEEYLKKLGGKISAVKNQQESEEAVLLAATNARARGCSEEEIARAAHSAAEDLSANSSLWEMDPDSKGAAAVSKYYSLAHSVREVVVRQPSQLRAGTLRSYQMVGLQWMLSLYNNRLNGILADEMGLGKTVQVMALIAYLMEFKGNNGPHLIIVPNAVMVNWKSELRLWIPHVSCVYYAGNKEERARLYSQEVAARKFNVLLTTYEFIMRDKSRLSKVDWKYLVIDEAQRMKDRESKLARDLDKYRCQRRLLLTGTPLQNDLNELWSLLNLLLPEVFDNSRAFNDWFATPFAKEGGGAKGEEEEWLETEKKVIVIHRLHQILEPFMLRRRVEDVEGSLPPKVAVVLKCQMSSYQQAVYDWVKATGTLRRDPDREAERIAGTQRTVRAYAPLQNRCMELRKVCNHPYLTYPPAWRSSSAEVVRCCGKLFVLDRILVKLKATGHRVLLFSTMTRLLDILEEYLQWRRLTFRRIDGTTPLDGREAAIDEFNKKDSDVFLFLLSIRAAGRGLNLQTADTVVIYDPDPNPKNEEQAIARAHRIGQKKEVRVIYLEAVVQRQPFHKKEDRERRRKQKGGSAGRGSDSSSGEEGEGSRHPLMGSIETLVRTNIQQHKIDMADEVINAGRFDQHTSQEERRQTLEALLKDEMRYQQRVEGVPSLKEVNRCMARSKEEEKVFNDMDETEEWPEMMADRADVPEWLRCGSKEVEAARNSTLKPSLRTKGGEALKGGEEEEEERGRGVKRGAKSREGEEARKKGEEAADVEAEEVGVGAEEEEEVEEEELWRKADGAEAEEREEGEEGEAGEVGEAEEAREAAEAEKARRPEEAGEAGDAEEAGKAEEAGGAGEADEAGEAGEAEEAGEEVAAAGAREVIVEEGRGWVEEGEEAEEGEILSRKEEVKEDGSPEVLSPLLEGKGMKRKRSSRTHRRTVGEGSEEGEMGGRDAEVLLPLPPPPRQQQRQQQQVGSGGGAVGFPPPVKRRRSGMPPGTRNRIPFPPRGRPPLGAPLRQGGWNGEQRQGEGWEVDQKVSSQGRRSESLSVTWGTAEPSMLYGGGGCSTGCCFVPCVQRVAQGAVQLGAFLQRSL